MAGVTKIKKQGSADGADRLGQWSEQDEYIGIPMAFGTGTGGTPSTGEIEYNHATPASATIVYINDTDEVGGDSNSMLGTISTGDVLQIKHINRSTSSIIFVCSGAITQTAGRTHIPVTYDSIGTGAAFINDDYITFTIFKGASAGASAQVIGGVTLSSSSATNILDGTYVILADTTTVTSVTSGIGQDSNWTLEITQAGITNQKGVITFTGNLEKDAGGGVNYDIAIFKNGSIVSESEQIDQKLESGGKGQSVTVMAIIEFSTNDTFDIRVSGNGTADDIFCGGGSLYIQ